MKRIFFFLTLLACCMTLCRPAHAQFFKNVLNSVKQTVQNRANDKASTTTNKAIDKVDPSVKPASPTPPAATTGAATLTNGAPASTAGGGNAGGGVPAGGSGGNGSTPPAGDPPSTAGYVRVAVSTNKTIIGSTVKITGFSPINGNLKTVVLTVSGPVPAAAVNISLKDSGSFSTVWVPASTGEFRLTFKTADGKAQTTVTVTAYPFQEMDQITGPTRELVVQAAKKVDDAIDKATG
jgi:hypothetical protein